LCGRCFRSERLHLHMLRRSNRRILSRSYVYLHNTCILLFVTILWVAFLDPSDSYFLFADLVGIYTHWTYMHIFLSNYWWQRSDIWSQASYRYPISWEAFLDPSDSYFLFAEERGYHKWTLAHSSSCIVAVSFIGGGNRRKLLICRKSLTNFIT
jgi:hypothetical protein